MNQVSREDQFVAGLCHASVLLPMLGAIVPLAVWLSQRQRSPILRFHALQALVYQLVGLLAYFALYACQMLGGLGMFAMFPLIALISAARGPAPSPNPPSGGPETILSILVLIVMALGVLVAMVSNTLQCFGGPLFAILGLWAAGRVLAGYSFRYPILGRWVARRCEPT